MVSLILILMSILTGIVAGVLVNWFSQIRNNKIQTCDLMLEAMWIFHSFTEEAKGYLKHEEAYEIEFDQLKFDIIVERMKMLKADPRHIDLIKQCRELVSQITAPSSKGNTFILDTARVQLKEKISTIRKEADELKKSTNYFGR